MTDLFFELLRVSLGIDNGLSYNPSEDEWLQLYETAEKQSVLGVCIIGLEVLINRGQRPTQTIILNWIGAAQQIEQRNVIVNQQCLTLLHKLNKDGYRACILKGQGNALLYGRINDKLSLLRQSGDIDVWGDGGFDKVLKYVQSVSPTEEINEQHVHLHIFKNTEVEVHFTPAKLPNRLLNKRLQRWFEVEKSSQMSHLVAFSDGEIVMPTNEFNYVYQMIHIYRHLLSEGIGMRQIMDYYVLMTTCRLNKDEIEHVKYLVDRFGLKRFAESLMWIMEYVFHVEETLLIWEKNEWRGRFVLAEIIQMGNFGHSDNRYTLSPNDSHLRRYLKMLKSKLRFFKYFPSETLWQPIEILFRFFEIRSAKKKAKQLIPS